MITNYFKRVLMGNIFHTDVSSSIPTTYYLALSSTPPADDGSNITEPNPNGSAYTRIALSSLEQAVDGVIKNEGILSFPESTDDWGTVSYYVIFDSLTDGNALLYGELDSPKNIESNTVFSIKTGNLQFELGDLVA